MDIHFVYFYVFVSCLLMLQSSCMFQSMALLLKNEQSRFCYRCCGF